MKRIKSRSKLSTVLEWEVYTLFMLHVFLSMERFFVEFLDADVVGSNICTKLRRSISIATSSVMSECSFRQV